MSFSRPSAKVIADSISPEGVRLTTMEVKFHRFVLAEFNTHRVFSRNSASSRAIPVAKMLIRVQEDPAMPLFWGKNQAGMGATEELDPIAKEKAIAVWSRMRDEMVQGVKELQEIGLHKQIANRALEPWMWHTAIVTSTEWTNFFAQRSAINPETNQPYAQPEMFELSLEMQKVYYESVETNVNYGEWHLPYITGEDREWLWKHADIVCDMGYAGNLFEVLKKISVGRCARVSYLTHDGIRDPLEDIKLADKLIAATPMHPSPFEHVATPHNQLCGFPLPGIGNFHGWDQYRHFFSNENVTEFTPNYQDFLETEE